MLHQSFTPASPAQWHETPAAIAYLASIDLDELFLTRKLVVLGDDCLHFSGDPVERLRDMRIDYINELFGCTFREAWEAGRDGEYADLEATQPRADEVLAQAFGDPRDFGNEDDWVATKMMRFRVRQAASFAARAA